MSNKYEARFRTCDRIRASSRLSYIEKIVGKLKSTKKLLPSPDEESLYEEALAHLVHVLSTKKSPLLHEALPSHPDLLSEDDESSCETDGCSCTKMRSKREERMEEMLNKLKCMERKRLYDPPADHEIGYYRLIKKYIRSMAVFSTSQKGSVVPEHFVDDRFDILTLFNGLHYLEELEEGNLHMAQISAYMMEMDIRNGYEVNPLLGIGMADVDEKTPTVICGSKERNNMFYHHKFRLALVDLMSSHHAFSPPYSEEKNCYEQVLDHIIIPPPQQLLTSEGEVSVYSDHLRYLFKEKLLNTIRTLENHCANVAKDILTKLSIPDGWEKLINNCRQYRNGYKEDVSEALLGFKREMLDKCEVSSSELPFLVEDVDRSLQIARYIRHYIRGLLYLTQNVSFFIHVFYRENNASVPAVVNFDWQALQAFTLFRNGCSFPMSEFQEKNMLRNHLAPSSKMENQAAVLRPQDEGTEGKDENGNVEMLKEILEEFRVIGDLCLEPSPSCREEQILIKIWQSITSSTHFFLCAIAYEQRTHVTQQGGKHIVRRTGRKRKREDVESSNLELCFFRLVRHLGALVDVLQGYKDGLLQKLKS